MSSSEVSDDDFESADEGGESTEDTSSTEEESDEGEVADLVAESVTDSASSCSVNAEQGDETENPEVEQDTGWVAGGEVPTTADPPYGEGSKGSDAPESHVQATTGTETPIKLKEDAGGEVAASPNTDSVLLPKTPPLCINMPAGKQEDSQPGNHSAVGEMETSLQAVTLDTVPTSTPAEEVGQRVLTRSITANRDRAKPKPSLGAKKLGAMRLQNLPHQDSPSAEVTRPNVSLMSALDSSTSSTSHQSSTSRADGDGSGGWGWFAPPKSLMSSVSSLTSTILSTVENINQGLNIPDPEELAKQDMLLEGECADEEVDDGSIRPPQDDKPLGFSQLIGGVSHIGSSLFSTGLDTLELLGKKTINVLQQNDPGLRRTKAVLANPLQTSQDRPCLSQVLREAKERKEVSEMEQLMDGASPAEVSRPAPTMTNLFELHNGLVHLEALEILSQQWQARIAPQIRRLTTQRRATIEEVAQLCLSTIDPDEVDPDEFDLNALEQSLTSHFDRMGVEVSLKKFMDAVRQAMDGDGASDSTSESVYTHGLDSLAQVASATIELMRKSAELLLMIPKNPAVGGKLEAGAFKSIAELLVNEVSRLGGFYANRLMQVERDGPKQYVTDIYFEASNCCSYIQNALKLMIPILQSRLC